jgi:hypothetical protein
VAASDEVVFAWAIGKALLILIVSVAALVYTAWAVPGIKPQKKRFQRPRTSDDGSD